MSYQQHGKIEATDINTTLAGATSPAAASTTLNAIWGTGSGDRGYGQTPYVSNVDQFSKITAAAWGSLVTTTSTINNHQGLTLPVAPIQPTQNALINYDAGYIKTNIDAVNNNRLFAKLQGVGSTKTTANNTVWNDNLVFNFTVTFPTSNQARYFFNAGGQLSINFSHPAGSAVGSRAVNLMFSQLCTACGTIVMSAMNTGTASIGGGNFTGITKLGGSGNPLSIDTNKGYYGLSPAFQTIFKQKSTAAVPGYYADSFLEIKARTNGSTGPNGDNGNIIYIQVLLDQVPNGASVSAGTTAYLTATPPAQAGVIPGAFLPVKSWEIPTITSTVVPLSGPSALPGPTAPTTPTPTTPTLPTYTFVNPAVATTQAPASSRTFTVSTTGVPNGTTLYWAEIGSYGFVGTNRSYTRGSVTINNNSGTFSFTLIGSSTAQPLGRYFVRLYTNNTYTDSFMAADSPTITLV